MFVDQWTFTSDDVLSEVGRLFEGQEERDWGDFPQGLLFQI